MSAFIEKPRFTCPLGGALATVGALPRAVAVLHASQGCGGNSIGAIMQGQGIPEAAIAAALPFQPAASANSRSSSAGSPGLRNSLKAPWR